MNNPFHWLEWLNGIIIPSMVCRLVGYVCLDGLLWEVGIMANGERVITEVRDWEGNQHRC
jgi:hypothetical protein